MILLSALIIGFLGSFHCVGMCGPIAFLLPVDRVNKNRRIAQIISYHLGRLSTYGLLGLFFGLLGKSFSLFGFQQHLSIGIGILMILIVLVPQLFKSSRFITSSIYKLVSKVKQQLGIHLKKRSVSGFYTLGNLNGLLPCGLVYMALFGAIALNRIDLALLYMLLFGIGTIPLMTTAVYLGNFLKGKTKQRMMKLIPFVVVVIGALFILRGLGLDIPYISPSEMVSIEKVATKHSCH